MSSVDPEQPTILIIDDKPANIRVLFDCLREVGCRTLAARSGRDGVKQALLAKPDLIMMDVMMPDMSGLDVCRDLKSREETKQIPVIFMTALADTADKVRGFEAGAVDYVTKPLQHEEVLARVHTHLAIHRMQVNVDVFTDLLLRIAQVLNMEGIWDIGRNFSLARPDFAYAGIWFTQDFAPFSGPPDAMKLHDGAGRVETHPSQWRHAWGDFSSVPFDEPLIGRAAAEATQCAFADESEWDRPSWAVNAGMSAYIATPLTYKGAVLGVLASFYNRPIKAEFTEKRKWHRILASYLGVAMANARAFEEIERLKQKLELENEYLREEVKEAHSFGEIVGQSQALKRVLDQVELVAPTDASVLILGESGTGKELIARAIHERSKRADGPMTKVNCAAIPRELFESEFFGHARGAFTGAVKDRPGRFERADGGTIFLDEVGEIPLELQSKLLRVLQEGSFERIGEEKTRTVNVRIIAATNTDLEKDVEAGRFRQDLYFRLSVFPLQLPPLRRRKEDIPLLAKYFIQQTCRKMGLPELTLKERHAKELMAHPWSGNVRELQNAVERAVILAKGGKLNFDLPEAKTLQPEPAAAATQIKSDKILSEKEWQELQRQNISRALIRSGWRIQGKGGAADLLGLKPTTLRSRMEVLGVTKRLG